MPQTGRLYTCARCREQVVVCRRCDRGQIYCPSGCAALARRERQRAAGARYQASRRGRVVHAERSRRYRQRRRASREIVTHQGYVAQPTDGLLAVTVPMPIRKATAATTVTDSVDPSPCCKHCGVRCPGGLRLGFVRHRRFLVNPGRDDHSIDTALLKSIDDHWP